MSRSPKARRDRLLLSARRGTAHLLACLLLAAGCLKAEHNSDDPLIGGAILPRGTSAGPSSGSTQTASADRPSDPLPDMPVPSATPTATAALASGVAQTANPVSSLHIVEGGTSGVLLSRPLPLAAGVAPAVPQANPQPGQPAEQQLPANASAGFEMAGAMLTGEVEPVPSPAAPQPTPGPGSLTLTGGLPPADTVPQLLALLKARGVVDQHYDGRTDEWHILCSIPNPSDPAIAFKFEATGVGEAGRAAAMRAVLAQIDRGLTHS